MTEGKKVPPLRGALQKGVEGDGRYYCLVESDGTTGEEWIKFFTEEGFPVESSAKSVLRSPDFRPTSGEKSIIVIFNLNSLKKVSPTPEFEDLVAPTAEIACLLRKKLKGPELKELRIEKLAVTHNPIIGLGNIPRILVVCCDRRGQRLSSSSVKKKGKLHGVDGIAFVVKEKR